MIEKLISSNVPAAITPTFLEKEDSNKTIVRRFRVVVLSWPDIIKQSFITEGVSFNDATNKVLKNNYIGKKAIVIEVSRLPEVQQ